MHRTHRAGHGSATRLGRPAQGRHVALIRLAFVFPLQLLAAVFGFLGRDGIAGTSIGGLAGTWLAIALVHLDLQPDGTSDALGLFLLVAAMAMLIAAGGALTSELVPAAVFATAAIRFATTGVAQLSADDTWKTTAGVVGLVLAALAIYAATAAALEDAMRRPCCPPDGAASDSKPSPGACRSR